VIDMDDKHFKIMCVVITFVVCVFIGAEVIIQANETYKEMGYGDIRDTYCRNPNEEYYPHMTPEEITKINELDEESGRTQARMILCSLYTNWMKLGDWSSLWEEWFG